jgi:hypothetical protein
MEKSVNEVMCLQKAVRERLAELQQLRNQVSITETYYGTKDRVVAPNYDVKAVDKKIVELRNFLLVVDSKIKQSNAITKIEIEVDINELLTPLQ